MPRRPPPSRQLQPRPRLRWLPPQGKGTLCHRHPIQRLSWAGAPSPCPPAAASPPWGSSPEQGTSRQTQGCGSPSCCQPALKQHPQGAATAPLPGFGVLGPALVPGWAVCWSQHPSAQYSASPCRLRLSPCPTAHPSAASSGPLCYRELPPRVSSGLGPAPAAPRQNCWAWERPL